MITINMEAIGTFLFKMMVTAGMVSIALAFIGEIWYQVTESELAERIRDISLLVLVSTIALFLLIVWISAIFAVWNVW